MNTNDIKPRANKNILHHLVDELSQAIENDPAALREALAEDGIEQDKLVQDGLQFIRELQEKQKSPAPVMKPLHRFIKVGRFANFPAFPRYAYALAAMIVVAIATWPLINRLNLKEYSAARGEQLEVFLPDGSKVKLNSDTRLALRPEFNKKSRAVTLTGEAFFEVQKGDLTFVIITEGAVIRVVGTRFNVKSRHARIEVAVSEGVVEVASSSAPNGSVVILTKGQLTSFRLGESPAPPQETYFESPAWTRGKLAFYQERLKDVAAELERCFDVTIELRDKSLEEIAITGQFENENLETILSAICRLINKNYRSQNEAYIIY